MAAFFGTIRAAANDMARKSEQIINKDFFMSMVGSRVLFERNRFLIETGTIREPAIGNKSNLANWEHECGFMTRSATAHYSPSPPSTARIWPVINDGAAAKNMTASAMSLAVPLRRIGVCLAIRFMNAAADFSPKSIIPGATALTAISGASAFAITFVSMCTAAFDEQ